MSEWKQEIVMMNPNELQPHPRRDEAGKNYATKEGLEELPPELIALQANILANGIQVPLVVQEGTNILITGHFRRAVAIEGGIEEVPVRYLTIDDDDAYMIMMSDNWERNSAIMDDPVAVAKNMLYFAYRMKLENDEEIKGYDYNNFISVREKQFSSFSETVMKNVGKKFDKSRASVRKHYQLLKLIPELQKWVSQKKIGFEGGTVLAGLDADAQESFVHDYQDAKRVADSEIKAFRDTVKTLVNRQTTDDATDETSVSIPANDEITLETVVQGESDEKIDDAERGADGEGMYDPVETGDVMEQLRVTAGVNHRDLRPASISVSDPQTQIELQKNKLRNLIKKSNSLITRTSGEFWQLVNVLREEIEENGAYFAIEELDQMEMNIKGLRDAFDTLKSHHKAATDRTERALHESGWYEKAE